MANQFADFPINGDIQIDDNLSNEQVYQVEYPSSWTMFFDGSKIIVVIGILFMTPFSLKLDFQCSHIITKYEALTHGIKIILDFKVR